MSWELTSAYLFQPFSSVTSLPVILEKKDKVLGMTLQVVCDSTLTLIPIILTVPSSNACFLSSFSPHQHINLFLTKESTYQLPNFPSSSSPSPNTYVSLYTWRIQMMLSPVLLFSTQPMICSQCPYLPSLRTNFPLITKEIQG